MTPRTGWFLLALWLASLMGTYSFASRNEANACKAAEVPVLKTVIVTHNKRAAKGHQAEVNGAVRAAKTEANFMKLEREIFTYAQKHPVAADCSIDVDGLRLWRAANSNADIDDARGYDGGLPGSSAASQRRTTNIAPESYTGSEDLSPVPGAVSPPGGVAGEDQ